MPDLAPVPTEPPAPAARLRLVFYGPDELRAGWRLLLFIALVVAISTATARLTASLLPTLGGTMTATAVMAIELTRLLVIVAATLVMSRLERRSLGDYGLPARTMFGHHFWFGGLWGFTMISGIIGLMSAARTYSLGELALPPVGILKYALLWGVAFLAVGFFEEIAFRGYLQFTLTTGMGFWPAAAVSSALFAWVHHGNAGETWFGLLNIVLIAAFLCLALRRTGSLWFPIGWHMAFDWGQSFFYSVPDSGTHVAGNLFNAAIQGNQWLTGGTVGPEASVFNVLVTAVGIVLFSQFYPEGKYPRAGALPGRPALLAAWPGRSRPVA